MNKNIAVCYRFYDKKSRRLALFCDFETEVSAKLIIIPCSKEDQFIKKEALLMYKDILAGKDIPSAITVIIPILPEERTLKTLFRYAYNNFYELRKRFKVTPINHLIKISNAKK